MQNHHRLQDTILIISPLAALWLEEVLFDCTTATWIDLKLSHNITLKTPPKDGYEDPLAMHCHYLK